MVPEGERGIHSDLRVVIKAVTDKFMDAIRHGDIYETLDEEEVMEGMVGELVKRRFDEETAKKEVAKVRIFDKEICGSISAEQQGKRESVGKRAEVRGRLGAD